MSIMSVSQTRRGSHLSWMFQETPHVHGCFLGFFVGSATTRGDCESQSCRCPPAMQSHWLRMVFLHRHLLFSRDVVTCLCALCVFVVKGGEDQKTFVSSLNFEHVTSCPRCAGRFGPDRGMDSSTSLCAGLRVQAKDAISFGAIGTPGLLLVPDVAE